MPRPLGAVTASCLALRSFLAPSVGDVGKFFAHVLQHPGEDLGTPMLHDAYIALVVGGCALIYLGVSGALK
jgi:hypothetical protein